MVAETQVEPRNRDLLSLAVPALGALAADPLMGLVDTALVGRLGQVPLAALGASTAILGLIFSVLVFLEYGTTARLARRFGAGQLAEIRRDAVQMAWVAAGLGLLVTLLIFLAPRPLLWLVDAPPDVVGVATAYLGIRALGAVPALWIRVANGVFRGLQDTRTPLGIVIGMNVLNALLDVLLIFGWRAAGIPALGVAGAAWATVVATLAGAIVFAVLLRRRFAAGRRRTDSFSAYLPHWATLRSMLAMSRDLLLRTVSLMAALFMGSRMAASLGTAALAAHQVGWQLWIFLALVLDSFAIAGQALVGRMLGAGRPDHARSIGNRLCVWGLGLGLFFAALFLALGDLLPRIFSSDPAVLAQVGSIFAVLALMQIPNAVLFAIDGLLIGASDFGFIRNAMIGLGLLGVVAAWLGREIGGSLLGVWVGISVFMVARLAVMSARWFGGAWSPASRAPDPATASSLPHR